MKSSKAIILVLFQYAFSIMVFGESTGAITIYPTEDAYVVNVEPGQNFGSFSNFMASSFDIYCTDRSLMKIDLSGIPVGAEIVSANLYLYGINHIAGSGSNGVLRKVTTSWLASTVTWNTQGNCSTVDEISLNYPTSSTQDYIVNIKNFVDDWLENPASNHGMKLMMDPEDGFRRLSFASSNYSNSTKHPKVVIKYCFPESVEINPTEDAYVVSASPTQNFGSFPNFMASISGGYVTDRSLMKIDLSSIPKGAKALSADLYLYGINHSTGSSIVKGALRKINSPWTESTATWNYQGSYTSEDQILLEDPTSSTQNYTIDIKNFVNDWLEDPTSNNGMKLMMDPESNAYRIMTFASSDYSNSAKRPKVILKYYLPNEYTEPVDISDYSLSLTDTKNYIHVITPLTEMGSIPTGARDPEEISEEVTYYDGLGREIQNIQLAYSPEGKDLITHVEYDEFGRKTHDFLPFTVTGNHGAFVSLDPLGDPQCDLNLYYSTNAPENVAHTDFPYAPTIYENSPLNRVLELGSTGKYWQLDTSDPDDGHTTKYEYTSNGTDVRLWTMTGDNCSNTTCYDANELFVYSFEDENENITREYKDKLGRVVLKESVLGQQDDARTYYVYDDFGLLRYVLTPEFVASLGTTASLTPSTVEVQDLCYYYKYDERKRLITKQLPGASPVTMMYDSRDRLVYSQDGEQAVAGNWSFTKYDVLNRPIITGEINDTRSSTIIQTDIDNTFASYPYEVRGSQVHDYTNNSFPSTIAENDCYSISYYDDYTFDYPDDGTIDCDFLPSGGLTSQDVTDRTTGFVTGTKTKVIMPIGTTSVKGWLYTLNYYDKKGRLIQSVQENHLDGLDRISNLYNFSNQITKSTHDHNTVVGSNTINLTEVTENRYDHQGRLLEVKHQIDQNDKVLLSAMKYNELGQLVEKYLNGDGDYTGTSSTLQKIDYRYNIRGWLTDINDPETLGDDLFGMRLCYTDIDDLIPISPDMQYNGNIAATIWNASGPNEGMQAYDYLYDDMNRLLAADYSDFASNWNNNAFDVYGRGDLNSQIEYDLNGNILSLKRVSHGTSLLHDLHYRYEGNQLMALGTQGNDASSSDQYQYDENGNLESDQNKSLAISYNYLNLPKKVDYNSGEKLLYYTYDAVGNKLRYNVYDNNQSDFIENKSYIGNIVYDETDGTEYDILYILTSEGRIVESSETYQYEYFLKDHLGNTRIRCREKDSEPYVQQESHYYPFGLQFEGTYNQIIEGENKYLFNGKELQDEELGGVNLDWYSYGARFYDPALGRWHSMDPHAENYLNWTPYNYVANNPLLLIDPNGMDWFYYKAEGDDDASYHWHDGSEYEHSYSYENEEGETVTESITLQGAEAVVVFDGYYNESLGTKEEGDKGYEKGKQDGYMDGDGAVTADVTVYGPDGADDIKSYTGYTMSSDPQKYGVVANGTYNANFDAKGKSGALKSNWTLNSRSEVPALWGRNPYRPNQFNYITGKGYLTGIFIHRSNNSGWAGGGVSKGCLLISPKDWKNFNNQMKGVSNFKVQVNRSFKIPTWQSF